MLSITSYKNNRMWCHNRIIKGVLLCLILTCELLVLVFALYLFVFNCLGLTEGEPFPWDYLLFSFVIVANIAYVSKRIIKRVVALWFKKG